MIHAPPNGGFHSLLCADAPARYIQPAGRRGAAYGSVALSHKVVVTRWSESHKTSEVLKKTVGNVEFLCAYVGFLVDWGHKRARAPRPDQQPAVALYSHFHFSSFKEHFHGFDYRSSRSSDS